MHDRKTSRAQNHGDFDKGTAYFVNYVPHGCSRVELNGTSLVNYANADVIVQIFDRSLKGGLIKADMITNLSYNQGQRRFLREQIHKTSRS